MSLTILPTATVSGTPPGGKTSATGATLTVGGAGVASYQYAIDSVQFSPDIPVATPIVLTGLADGNYSFSATACDYAGNCHTPGTRTVQIDTAAPGVSFIPYTDANQSLLSRAYVRANLSGTDANGSGVANLTLWIYNSTGALANYSTGAASPSQEIVPANGTVLVVQRGDQTR